jgi:hypothetical protein
VQPQTKMVRVTSYVKEATRDLLLIPGRARYVGGGASGSFVDRADQWWFNYGLPRLQRSRPKQPTDREL